MGGPENRRYQNRPSLSATPVTGFGLPTSLMFSQIGDEENQRARAADQNGEDPERVHPVAPAFFVRQV